MKGKYKKTIALLMTLIMVISINITALAEDSIDPSSIQEEVVESTEFSTGDENSTEANTLEEIIEEDEGNETSEETDTEEEVVEEEEEERTEKENEDNATGSGDEGEVIEGDGEEEDAGADDGEEEETEKNGGEQEGIAESGQSGIDGDKDVEGIVDIEEQLDLEDNPDNITADEAYIENLGFYYPALIKMYKMMAQSPNSDEIIWPAPGAINLLKEAEPYGDLGNQWEVTLTIEGKNVLTTSRVVLVIDKSGSMKGAKMANTISAAQKFVNELLLNDGMTEIAVVSFDKNVHLVSSFVGFSDKNKLITAIGKIKADGGTNIQAGIQQAQILLDAATADNKVMVLLGDGEATYSYKVIDASGITLTGHTGWSNKTPVIEYDSPEILAVEYDTIVGSGSSYNISTSSHRYQIPCAKHDSHATTFPEDNGIATIWEAGLAKEKGTRIYSIALNAGTNGNYVLNQCQDSGFYILNSSELDVLGNVFDEIAGQIAYAANEAIVIDPMGPMFNLLSGLGEISISQGTAEITGDGRIKWNIGTIKEGSPATMKYKIKIKNGADKNVLYPTNDITTIKYKDLNGKDAEDEFVVPEVSVGGGKILFKGYLVNEEGEPIGEGGAVVARPDLAKRLYDHTYSETPLDYNHTYIITKSDVAGHNYMGYVWNESSGTTGTVSVLLLSSAPTQTVWFGYVKRNDVTVTFEENYLGASASYYRTIESGSALKANMPPNPNRLGYSFTGWYPNKDGTGGKFDSDTIVTSDITVYAQWAANADTKYKVEHYQQDVTGTGYTVYETEELTGTTGAAATASPKSYTGFSENTTHTGRVASGIIAADGSLILKLYYDRNVFTVTFKDHDDIVLKTESVRYGGNATPPANPTREGYTFASWYGNYTNVTQNEIVVATYTPITNICYTVNYLEQGTNKVLAPVKHGKGTFGKVVTENAIDIVGYDKVAPTSKSITIAMTGNVINFYYKAKCLCYTVNYLEQGTNQVLAPVKHGKGTFGKVVTENAIDIEGYYKVEPTSKSITIAMTGNAINFYYTARTDIEYTVNYLEKDTNKILAEPKNGVGTFGIEVTENAIDIEGYDKVEPVEVKLILKLSGNIINFYYTASTGIEYIVKYLEQGTEVELAPAKIVSGKTFGTVVTEEAIEIYGFTPDAVSKSLLLSSKENVITFVYSRNTYTISYIAGENGKLEGGDREDKKLYGDSYDAAPKPIANSGYKFEKWMPPLPGTEETIKEDKTFIASFSKVIETEPSDKPDKPRRTTVTVPVEPVPKDLPKLNKKDHMQYIQGYPDGTVKPEGYITRDEVAAVFYRLLDPEYRDRIKTQNHKFSDVASNRWSNKHIATLAKVGIVKGYPDGTFKPGNHITRAEVATIASRFDKLSPFESDKFSDITGHWANKYINSAEKKGWIKGYSDGTFRPDKYITRAEFVTLVNNVLERRVKKSEILPDAKQFPDLPKNGWFYEAMQEAINSHHYIRLDDGYEEWLEIYYPDLEM